MYKKICFAILLISIIICVNILRLYSKIEKFNNKKYNFNNDGLMTFDFLSDTNTKRILDTYYLDTDIKVNGQKLNFHPYEKKVANYSVDEAKAFPYIYGNPATHIQRTPHLWKKYDTEYQDIYNKYRIRR
jgi:hypothetical protein